VSPKTNTVLSDGATFSIKNFSSKTFLLLPIIILSISLFLVKILNQLFKFTDNFMTLIFKML